MATKEGEKMDYSIWLFIHVLAVIVLLGNIGTGLFWKFHAERYHDHNILRSVFQGIHRSDLWLTNIAVAFILLSGLMMAYLTDVSILYAGWMVGAIAAFIVSGIVYAFKIIPLHEQIIGHLDSPNGFTDAQWEVYDQMKSVWLFWAMISTSTPFISLYFMFFKPQLY